ncbi:hypothetical protein ABZ721_10760 [Streptomyces sp. NPDC006733]|uniref:lipase/acyltransferase domain-containing protein n=1 Tax=Streptomyces sp. NPDC006733 TaxID=3155460 RepID=UPI0034026870
MIPGIMGSELVDAASGRVLWGINDPRWYVKAWLSGTGLSPLHLTPDEREGTIGRVRPSRLLRAPAYAPVLRGIEPYARLVAAVRGCMADPGAVLEFPYDWRLPVAVNARLLAAAAERHLEAWRAADPRNRQAQLVLVAHSMGGLLAWHFTALLGGSALVRSTVTLGTPFFGSVKAALILGTGVGGPLPLPKGRLRALAATLPGLYDLLPRYRCVDEGTTARRLTAGDVGSLGGDDELAAASSAWHEHLAAAPRAAPDARVQLVGDRQRTLQSLTLRDGVPRGHAVTCRPAADGSIERVDLSGDETVYAEAAALPGVQALPLPQSHSGLCNAEEVAMTVRRVLLGLDRGPWLAPSGGVGLRLPDLVVAGEAFEVAVDYCDSPVGVRCTVEDAATGRVVDRPLLAQRDGVVRASAVLGRPGLYRLGVKTRGFDAVTQLVLAGPAAHTDRGADSGRE